MSQPSSDGLRQPAIVILDFGSQYSELIARRVRETEVFSVVLGYSTSAEELRAMQPKGIILSGGPSSVYADHAPLCDPAIWGMTIKVMRWPHKGGGGCQNEKKGIYGHHHPCLRCLHRDPNSLFTARPREPVPLRIHRGRPPIGKARVRSCHR